MNRSTTSPAQANITLWVTTSGINNGLAEPYSKEQYNELLKTWALAIADYPGAYLEHRAELSSGLYGIRSYPLVLAHAYGAATCNSRIIRNLN